jgi:glyoxylase-like metal-dependent hydrolase (beta-lactamase superfamily II)
VRISARQDDTPVPIPVGIALIRANNAGPLTLGGTNTWILGGRASGTTVVIDPGPALPDHLAAVRAAGRPAAIVLTHGHADHSAAAAALAAEFDIPVYAALAERSVGSAPLADGDLIGVAGWELAVIATPGHTSDSVCLALEGAVMTGDTLLGGSTTIIAPPSGSLAAYLESITRLREFHGVVGLPGHGPVFGDVGDWATQNADYRERRLEQLATVFTRISAQSGDVDRETLLRRVASTVYGEDDEPVAAHIEVMVAAQVQFLAERGDIPG